VTDHIDPVHAAGPVGVADDGAGESAAVGDRPCAVCGETLVAGAKFCEACGASADADASAAASADTAFGSGSGAASPPGGGPPPSPAATAAGPDPGSGRACDNCGGAVADDGYCTSCGHRALDEVTVDDRGDLAYATHRGRRHPRNEDSAALGHTSEGWPVLVVSDGVSVSPNPHRASAAAVAAAVARLDGHPFGGEDDLLAAIADAHEAVVAVPGDDDPHWTPDGSHPACTIVVAVAAGATVHVANVGDARAHLLHGDAVDDGDSGDSGRWTAAQITTDDSVAAQAVAQGIEPEIALNLPGGHGITAWLGADATSLEPHVATVTATPGDILLADSDGLWNYAPTDAAMGGLLSTVLPPPGTPLDGWAGYCTRLVDWANDQGGSDNITVAITPLHPELEDRA